MGALNPDILYKNLSKDLVDALDMSCYDLAALDIRGSTSLDVAHGISLSKAILKKWEPLEDAPHLRATALAGFVAANDLCSTWTPNIENPLYQTVLDQMALEAARELGPISWMRIFQNSRTGPGASVLSKGKNSAFEKLFLNRMSTTSKSLYSEYLRCCRAHPTHLAAELRRHELRGPKAVRVVEGSTLSTVRKNDRTDRVICTEPSLNMFFQLGFGELLNKVLQRRYGYNPAIQQTRNRKSACLGSLGQGRSTIDLSSASDTISLGLVKYVMRPDWYAAIEDLRSPLTKIDGKYTTLHMVSSMGNGFTFPLQTYLFSLAIKCLCKVLGVEWVRFDVPGSPFGVFGDDIIVPDSLYDASLGLLRALGFLPNSEKSFGSGPFRESCGSDWFNGHNVRGVYIRKLSSQEDRFSAINRLNMWSARTGIPLRRTIRYLLPKGWRRYVVPMYEAEDAGLYVPYIQKSTYLRRQPIPSQVRVFTFRHQHLYPRYNNLFGFVLSAVEGYVRSGYVSRRQRETIYEDSHVQTAHTWVTERDLLARGVARKSHWEALTYYNMDL